MRHHRSIDDVHYAFIQVSRRVGAFQSKYSNTDHWAIMIMKDREGNTKERMTIYSGEDTLDSSRPHFFLFSILPVFGPMSEHLLGGSVSDGKWNESLGRARNEHEEYTLVRSRCVSVSSQSSPSRCADPGKKVE
jgi:hypothetical protein